MFKRIIAEFQKAQMRRVSYWQLYNLTDSNLKDIGITRKDIRRIVYEEL
jgi:uncharacterized protein YjiS (DUF1127 family)